MVLVLVAAIGCFVGYRMGITRAGYVTISFTIIAFSAGQTVYWLLARSPETVTMMPIIVGLDLALFMVLGGLLRQAVRRIWNDR
jgi:hypothetical protein